MARDARLHSLSLELLSLSESDSELLSDSLELPEAPLEWPPGSLLRGVGPGRLQTHIQMSRELFTCCTIKYKSLQMGAGRNVICRDVKSLHRTLDDFIRVNVKKQSNTNIQFSKVNNAKSL